MPSCATQTGDRRQGMPSTKEIAKAKAIVADHAGKRGRKPREVVEAQELLDDLGVEQEEHEESEESEEQDTPRRMNATKAALTKGRGRPAAAKEEKVIKIPRLCLKTISITIVGISGLLVNRFDEKVKQQLEDDHQGKAKNKKTPATPDEEFRRSLYVIDEKKKIYGIPSGALKNCVVSACRYVDGIAMTTACGAFHVENGINGLIPIKSKGPEVDKRLVRVGPFGSKKPATRYRAIFHEWEATFQVTYNEGVITAEQLLNLYENAGFSVGICEFRPEKKGSLGMFRVKRKD